MKLSRCSHGKSVDAHDKNVSNNLFCILFKNNDAEKMKAKLNKQKHRIALGDALLEWVLNFMRHS
jgi:hypothetical protein